MLRGVTSALLGATSSLPTSVLAAIGGGILVLGVLVGVLLGRRSGNKSLAQRLVALGSRLGVGPEEEDYTIEGALSYLEAVTGAATEAVTDSSADAIRLRRSLDVLPLGLVLCDESGSVIYRNAVASTMMESRGGDALAAQAVTDLLAEAWDKGEAEKTLDLYGPPRRTLGVHATLIDDGRRPLGVIAVIEDVSERRRLDDVRRDFIANVSHELKTPMGALGLLAETLMDERDRDVATRLAERIHHEAFRVSRIIDDLLDLSRLESELGEPNDPVPVNLAIVESIDRVRASAEHRSIRLDVEELDPPVTIIGDRRQLVSALHALLENAITYAPEGSVVSITGEVVEAGDEAHDDGRPSASADAGLVLSGPVVRVSVTDRGMGIPTNDLERVFERFYRVDRGRSRETGGTGLGLSIVRHVAVNHHGTVEVESREGEGSTFTLVLPVPKAAG
jgi:two-component system sensor histidine kinase SenX3